MKMLTNVVIGNNVTTIGPNAFRICTSLTEITIPENITTIDNYAFYGCEYLVEINSMNPTPPTIKSNTFGNVDKNMCVLNVPIGSKEAYAQADYWSEFYNINEVDFAEESDGIEKILTNLDEEAVIHCEERNLVIQGKNLPVVVYDLTGRLVRQKTVQQEKRIELPNGYYIVKAGSTTQKIWVGG